MVVLRRDLQIVVQNDADLPHGCHRSSADADSAQVETDFPCGLGGSSAEPDSDFSCGQAWIFHGRGFHAVGHGFSVRAGRGSSAQMDMDLSYVFLLKMAETRR